MKTRPHPKTRHDRQRGSALLTAIIFTFVAAMLSVSYLKLAYNEYTSSVRSYLSSSVFNLAEAGVELGIDALATGTANGSTYTMSKNSYLSDGQYAGDIDIVILNANTSSPTIYAEGIITGHSSGELKKQIKVELTSGFTPFERGFAARNGIVMSGNGVTLDSYNSTYGAYGDPLPISAPSDFGVGGRNISDDITVASDTMVIADGDDDEEVISQGNADIYGYVAIRPGTTISIGRQGMVTSYDSGSHDDSRITYDFYADFPTQSTPSTSSTLSSITSHQTISGGTYSVDSISMSGSSTQVVTINGDVTLVVTGDISFTGQSSINVTSGSSLTIYAEGDVAIGGNGIVNTDLVPADVSIIGTQDVVSDGSGGYEAGQSIKIAGNGQLAANVYAPGADISLNGGGTNGNVYGAAVGFTSTVTGGSAFHFDEALRDIMWGGGNYTIDSWLEMTSATVASTPVDMLSYMTP